MITSTELKIFKLLREPLNISQLAGHLELGIPAVSRCVSGSLMEPDNGLFLKERIGKGVVVRRAATPHAQILSSVFIEFARQPLEKMLSNNHLRILGMMLDNWKTVKDTAHILQITREHAYKCLGELARHGLVVKKGREYRANPQNGLIIDFVRSYHDYSALHAARSLAPDSTVLWRRGCEFLFKTNAKIVDKTAKLTAVSKFPGYGLPLISSTNYYFCTLRELELSDFIIHTILIDTHNPVYNTYACLLYQKTKPVNLMNVAKMYDLTEHISALLNYLETHERPTWLFSWDEYEELARDYGVTA